MIDADALQKLFNEVSSSLLCRRDLAKDTEHMVRAFLMVTEMIQDAPTVDAVPVVRCEDCVHWREAVTNDKGFLIRPASGMEITESDFCSYSEREETNDTGASNC